MAEIIELEDGQDPPENEALLYCRSRPYRAYYIAEPRSVSLGPSGGHSIRRARLMKRDETSKERLGYADKRRR